jgi:hypothetical protein
MSARKWLSPAAAAPALGKGGPIPAAWCELLAERRRQVRAEYRRDCKEYRAFLDRVARGVPTPLDQLRLGLGAATPVRLTVTVAKRTTSGVCHRCQTRFLCRSYRTRYCSERCYAEAQALHQRGWRAERAKSPLYSLDDRPCGHCRREFRPKRRDTLYCSIRCRVAAHRAKAKEKTAPPTGCSPCSAGCGPSASTRCRARGRTSSTAATGRAHERLRAGHLDRRIKLPEGKAGKREPRNPRPAAGSAPKWGSVGECTTRCTGICVIWPNPCDL